MTALREKVKVVKGIIAGAISDSFLRVNNRSFSMIVLVWYDEEWVVRVVVGDNQGASSFK